MAGLWRLLFSTAAGFKFCGSFLFMAEIIHCCVFYARSCQVK